MLTLSLDLDHDGSYAHADSDLTPYLLAASWSLGREAPHDLLPAVGQATFTLHNSDGRFSPENGSSPLAGLLVKGRRVRVQLATSGGPVTLWQGWLDTVAVTSRAFGPRQAILQCRQGLERLHRQPAGLPVQLNTATGLIIDSALSRLLAAPTLVDIWQLGIAGHSELDDTAFIYDPAGQLQTETGQTTFPYAGDTWTEATPLLAVIRQLVAAEDGVFWQDRDGRFQFRDRHFWLLNNTPADSFSVDDDTVAATYGHGADVVNRVQVTAYPRQLSGPQDVIWAATDPLSLPPGNRRSLSVRPTDDTGAPVGVVSIVPPVAAVDFTAADDKGTDITGQLRVLVRAEGSTLHIEIISSASRPGLLSLQVRGQTVRRREPVSVTASDPFSLAEHGLAAQTFDLLALSSSEAADDFARWTVYRRATPRGALTSITLLARNPTWQDRLAILTVGTRVQISAAQPAHNGDYFVVGERFAWSPEDGLRGTFILRPAEGVPFWQLDSSLLGQETVLAY